jgi:MFS family permease
MSQPSDVQPTKHDPYAALRLRNFRLYFMGNVLAVVGMQMQSVAVGWDIYLRTESKLALGLVGLVQFLPVIVLAPIAGHVADRFNRKWIVAIAMVVMSQASLALAWVVWTQADHRLMYVCLLVSGMARAFQQPAKSSLVPQIVPKELFSNAVTWNSSGFHLAAVCGPAAGGFLISFAGTGKYVYLVDAAAALCFVVAMALIQVRRTSAASKGVSLVELAAGFQFVRHSPVILGAITLDMFAVLFGGATMLLPVFATDILHVGAYGLGWMRAAPAVGALMMAMILAHHPPLERAGRALLWSVAGFGAVTIVFGFSTSFALSLAMLFLTGACDNVSVVIRHTLVQTLTPDELRGRVSAVNSLFIGASNELGGFESGLIAHWFGPVISVVSGGIGTLIVVAATAFTIPKLRRYGRL